MSDQRITIPRTSDTKIAAVYKQLAQDYGVPKVEVTLLGISNGISPDILSGSDNTWNEILRLDNYIISSLAINIGSLCIRYFRGGRDNDSQNKKSLIYDEIILNHTDSQKNTSPSIQQRIKIVAFLNTELHPFEYERLAGRNISEQDAQLLAIHESTLVRLEQLNEYLVRQSADFRERKEKEFEADIRKNAETIQREKANLEAEHTSRLHALAEQEKALNEKIKAVDDRDNTHARRQIRDKMLDDVKARIAQFGVSDKTAKKRSPVFSGIFLLGFSFIVLIALSAYEFSVIDRAAETAAKGSSIEIDKGHVYWLLIRSAFFSFGLVGTILYYIKWQNRWAEQHSASEFQLQQFYIDVNRANWVIESCLEWQKETGSPIPKELLVSITNNLFVNTETDLERVIHPADELASAIMGSASKLKLNIGGNEIEIDKPGKNISNKPLKSTSKQDSDT